MCKYYYHLRFTSTWLKYSFHIAQLLFMYFHFYLNLVFTSSIFCRYASMDAWLLKSWLSKGGRRLLFTKWSKILESGYGLGSKVWIKKKIGRHSANALIKSFKMNPNSIWLVHCTYASLVLVWIRLVIEKDLEGDGYRASLIWSSDEEVHLASSHINGAKFNHWKSWRWKRGAFL